jgi:hypothetical protein
MAWTMKWTKAPSKLLAPVMAVAAHPRWREIRAANKLRSARDRGNIRTWPDGRTAS